MSGVPLPHLSYLLAHLIPNEHLFFYTGILQGRNFPHCSYDLIGSSADKTNCVLLDRNIDGSLKKYHSQKSHMPILVTTIAGKFFVSSGGESRKDCLLITDDTDSHPGYCRLRPVNPDPKYWGELLIKMESGEFFLTGDSEKGAYMGYVCQDWPAQAAELLNRDRPNNWLSLTLLDKLSQEKCLLINRPHAFSDNPALEWQYVFFRAEKLLFSEGLTEDQRQCYNVFKVVVDFFSRHLSWQLSSTHLKAIFFSACEVIPRSYWTDSFGGCYLYLVANTLRCVQNRKVPNYFIKENNMIDHVDGETLAQLEIALEYIRQFPVESAAFLIERHGYKDGWFMTNVVMEDIPVYIRDKERNLNRVVQRVFVPTTLKLAMKQANREKYTEALKLVDDAYQQLLMAPPSPDGSPTRMPKDIHHFIREVVNNIECDSVRHLLGDYLNQAFGKEVIPRTKGENILFVKDLTNGNDVGGIGNAPVPKKYTDNAYAQAQYLDFLALDFVTRIKPKESAECLGYAVDLIEKALTSDLVDPSTIDDPVMKKEVSAQCYQNTFKWTSFLNSILQHLFILYSAYGQVDMLTTKLVQVQDICERFPNPVVLKYVIDIWGRIGYGDMAAELKNKLAAIGGGTMDQNCSFDNPFSQMFI